MKKYILLLLMLMSQQLFSQNETNEKASEEFVFSAKDVQVKPEFPGGIEKFYQLFIKNFKSPEQEGLKGRVLISFIVEVDGTLSNYEILEDVGFGTADEAIRVLKLSPKWLPAEHEGKKVRANYKFPIHIENAR